MRNKGRFWRTWYFDGGLPSTRRALARATRRSRAPGDRRRLEQDAYALLGNEPLLFRDQVCEDRKADEYDDRHSCAGCGLAIEWSPGGMYRVDPWTGAMTRHSQGLCSGNAEWAAREMRWYAKDLADCWEMGLPRAWDTPEEEQAKALIMKAFWAD